MTLNDLKEGDVLVVQTDSGCTPKDARVVVQRDAEGNLYYACDAGRHYLLGQVDTSGALVGLIKG